jgi:hypothetical protein
MVQTGSSSGVNVGGVMRSHIRTQCDSNFLHDMRKGTALFDGSQASPACPSDKILLRCRWVFSIGGVILTGETEVLGEWPVPVPLCPRHIWPGLTLPSLCRGQYQLHPHSPLSMCATGLQCIEQLHEKSRRTGSYCRLDATDRDKLRGLSGKYPAILNISRTGRLALM